MTSKSTLDPNFITVINLLNENNIPYWLCQGTLLGIIRDNKLIEWDHDIDVAVWSGAVEKKYITDLLSKANFKTKAAFMVKNDVIYFIKDGGRIVDINFYQKIKLKSNNKEMAYVEWLVPKNIFMKLIDAISTADKYEGKFKKLIRIFTFIRKPIFMLKKLFIKIGLFYKRSGHTAPVELFQNTKKIKFHGLEIKIPSKTIEYLEYIYGPNWQIPKKNYNWQNIKDSPSTVWNRF